MRRLWVLLVTEIKAWRHNPISVAGGFIPTLVLFVGFGALFAGMIWAHFAWGAWWSWDPKEVFALNTWLLFLVLVHIRFKVKDKALWTAVLAVIGCAVMLFNWIAVNFVIVGLHSYA